MNIMDNCIFPELEEKYSLALREAIESVEGDFSPILGIIAAGSIMRGEGDEYSDIDLFVIFEGDYRQLIHKWFNGVPVQIFANPPQRIPQYFEEQSKRLDGGPSTAHMLATGFVVYDNDPRIEQIQAQAKQHLETKPQYNEGAVQHLRYSAADLIENMLDLKERDPDMAIIMFNTALPRMLRYYFLKQNRYIPRHKDIMKIIREENPQLAKLIHETLVASGDERFEQALKLANVMIEAQGLFDYTWEKEKI